MKRRHTATWWIVRGPGDGANPGTETQKTAGSEPQPGPTTRRDCHAVWTRRVVLLLLLSGSALALPRGEPTVEQLKARVASTSIKDRPRLCVQIAERQLDETDKLYSGEDYEKAQATLADVVAYAELARDYAIQSHKHQKQAEIAVRGMTRRLKQILHSLGQADQGPVTNALDRLEQVRNDLLDSMFKKVRHD